MKENLFLSSFSSSQQPTNPSFFLIPNDNDANETNKGEEEGSVVRACNGAKRLDTVDPVELGSARFAGVPRP